jgi:hypothetical protein
MERKKALTVAAGLSAAVFAAATAIGVNVGILNSAAGDDPDVGSISAEELVDTTSSTTAVAPPETIVIDEYVTATPTGGGSGGEAPVDQLPASEPTAVPWPAPPSAGSESGTTDDHGGDRYVDDDEDHEDYEDYEDEDEDDDHDDDEDVDDHDDEDEGHEDDD